MMNITDINSNDEMEQLIRQAATVLYRTRRATAAHLSRRLDISRRQATTLLTELEKRKLVTSNATGGRRLVNLHDIRPYLLKTVHSLNIEQLEELARDVAADKGHVTSEELFKSCKM